MEKAIKNNWNRKNGSSFATANILDNGVHPEGLDVKRIRFYDRSTHMPNSAVGHIISILTGNGKIILSDKNKALNIGSGVHLYLPPEKEYVLNLEAGTEILKVSGSSGFHARGDKLLLRDEKFLSACAVGMQSLRWILTPQYLSRRIFLYNDKTLLSKADNPVSWFRTTMFDVTGLPKNDEGESVFKMSYNSKTEFNVCYEVEGEARVRMAKHPYQNREQNWSEWICIDGETTYHLNEAAGGPEEEYYIDKITNEKKSLRNRHEVYIQNGYVTLFCLFDPAPTGIERHKPGEYSDYEPLSKVIGTKLFENYQKEIAKFDKMVDQLSIAKAENKLEEYKDSTSWELYLRGKAAQKNIETALFKSLEDDGKGRSSVILPWMQT